MNRPPTHRYQIWTHARYDQDWRPRSASTHQERGEKTGRFGNSSLLYADLGGSARPLITGEEDGGSLYHYGLPIEIELPGRCTLPNGRSAACKTKKISSEIVDLVYEAGLGSYRIKAPEEFAAGALMQLDLEEIGKFYGALTSQSLDSFQISVDGECKDAVSTKLARLALALRSNSLDEGVVIARPTITRLEPDTKSCRFTDHTGALRKGTIINVSQVDALIKAAIVPPVGVQVVFCGVQPRPAEVIRAFEIGFAVKFCPPIPAHEFSAAIKFVDD